MGAIGDYIHYKQYSYINPNKKYPTPAVNEVGKIIQNRKRQIAKYTSKKIDFDVQLIQNNLTEDLNMLQALQKENQRGSISLSDTLNDPSTSGLIKAYLEDLSEIIGKEYVSFTNINFNALVAATNTANIESLRGMPKFEKKIGKNAFMKLDRNLDALAAYLSSLEELDQGNNTITSLKKKIATAKSLFNEGLNNLNFEIQEDGKNLPRFFKKNKDLINNIRALVEKGSLSKDAKSNEQKIADAFILYNKILAIIRFGIGKTQQEQTSVITEAMAAAGMIQMNRIAGKKAIEAVSRTGNNTSGVGLSKLYMTESAKKYFTETNFMNKQIAETDNFIVFNSNVAEKSDVTVTLKDQTKKGIQVKSYKKSTVQNYGVHFLSEANFLSLVQNENYDNFVTHYLSLNARYDSRAKMNNINMKINIDKKNINYIMQQLLLIKGISGINTVRLDSNGNVFNQTEVELLVFYLRDNDYNNSKVIVMSIPQLIKGLIKNRYSDAIKIPTDFPNEFIGEQGIPNESLAWNRVNQMWSQLINKKHQINIRIPKKSLPQILTK